MQVTTMANILKDAKIVKKNERQLKFKKKIIIITLQLSIMEAKIKPLSKEVTVMT